MENNRSFVWPQGFFLVLIAFFGSLSLTTIIHINFDASQTQVRQSLDFKDVTAKMETQKRIEGLRAAMLTTWQQQARTKNFAFPVPARFQGSTIAEAKLSSEEKVIALTFDDGPWPTTTAQVLDILKKNNIKATFFLVGQMLKNYPALGKQIVTEGHVIGNHTWHHWYHHFNHQAAAFEIEQTSDLIYEVTGIRTTLFRPPGGILHNGLAAYAKNQNYTVIMWSVDSLDYKQHSATTLVNRVLKQSVPGGIVLLHDGGGNRSVTVKALPYLIQSLREQGYRFVTIPELLEMKDRELAAIAAQKKHKGAE